MRDSFSPPRVIGKSKGIHASLMPLQFKGSDHFPEISTLAEAHFPHLYIRSESTWTNKPIGKKMSKWIEPLCELPLFYSSILFRAQRRHLYSDIIEHKQMIALPYLPHGDTVAKVLFIWLVLMLSRISPFMSQIRMVVSLEALMIYFPGK